MPRQACRRLLTLTLTLAAASTLFAAADGIIESSRQHPPHVALIVSDHLPRETLSAYGGPAGPTALERFAAQAVVYEQAFTPHPDSVPALASVFTGLFETSHACRGTDSPLRDDFMTLAEALAARGYRTIAVIEEGNHRRDADATQDARATRSDDSLNMDALKEAGLLQGFAQVVRHDGRGAPDILNEVPPEAPGPVFLFVLLSDTNGDESDGEPDASVRIAAWLAVVESRLERQKSGKSNTLTILSALRGSAPASDEPAESALREPVVRVPLLAAFPDAAGRRLGGMCQLVDVPATIYDQILAWDARQGLSRGPRRCLMHAAGLTLSPDEFRGREFAFTKTRTATPKPKESVELWMVRSIGHKAIFGVRGEAKLFDLASDPDERRNLIEPGSPWAAKASSLETARRHWHASQPSTDEAIRIRPRGIAD